jgi:hypothetical protein
MVYLRIIKSERNTAMLTFKEFQDTKVFYEDLATVMTDYDEELRGVAGYVYAGYLYIDRDSDEYHLILCCDEYWDKELGVLEKTLYDEWYAPEHEGE